MVTMENNKDFKYWENNKNSFNEDISAICFAIDWLTKKLRNPEIDLDDQTPLAIEARLIKQKILVSRHKEEFEKELRQFQRELFEYLTISLASWAKNGYVFLLCKYQPIDILDTLSAKYKTFIFPQKTYMLISRTEVKIGSTDKITDKIEPSFLIKKEIGNK